MQRLLEMAGSTGRRGDVAIYVDGFRDYRRVPPKGAIDMIRINSNPFSAEFSQPSVRRVEITTKPGSDGFHGDATVRARDNRLNERNPLSDTKPQGLYQSVNGYLQGPIKKGRIGFLVYGGQWREDDNAIVNATVLDTGTNLSTPFSKTISTPTTVTSFSIRTDFRFFNQSINLSYEGAENTESNRGLASGFDLLEHGYDHWNADDVGRMWWTSIGSRSLNDVRVELMRRVTTTTGRATSPEVLVLDAFNAGGNQNAGLYATTVGVQASDTFTILLGRHALKTGVRLETTEQRSVDRSGFNGTFTFGADVERDAAGQPVLNVSGQSIAISPIERYRRTVLGLAGYGPSQFDVETGAPNVSVQQWNAGWFALDDWSVSKAVSISYGVRQELQNNLKPRLNLAPRASLAWLLDGQGRNAVKVGAGLFYAPVEAEITLDVQKFDGTHRRQMVVANPSFFPTIPRLDLAAGVSSAVLTKSDDLRMPYSVVTTVSYEHVLGHGIFGTAQYQFVRGINLTRMRNTQLSGSSDDVSIARVLQFESSGRSMQHELLVALRGDIGRKVSMYGNYTLGRKKSDSDGPYTIPADSRDLSSEYGYSIDDRQHQITAGTTATMPGGLVFIPSVTIASGRPFNITTGLDNNGDALFADRPAFAQPGDAGAVTTAFGVFNPNPRPGDVIIPRNFGREPWQRNVNLAVFKKIKALSVTVDAENVLNIKRYTALNGVLISPVFGLPSQALNARRFELAIRLGF
jgi:hypothetical protein